MAAPQTPTPGVFEKLPQQPKQQTLTARIEKFAPEKTFQDVLDQNPDSGTWSFADKAEVAQAYQQKYLDANPQWQKMPESDRNEYLGAFTQHYGLQPPENNGFGNLWNTGMGALGDFGQGLADPNTWVAAGEQVSDAIATQADTYYNKQLPQAWEDITSGDAGKALEALNKTFSIEANPQWQATGYASADEIRSLAQGVSNIPSDIANTYTGKNQYSAGFELPKIDTQVQRDNPVFDFIGRQAPYLLPVGEAFNAGKLLKGTSSAGRAVKAAKTASAGKQLLKAVAENAAIAGTMENPEGIKGRLSSAAAGATVAGVAGGLGAAFSKKPIKKPRRIGTATLKVGGELSTRPVIDRARRVKGDRIVDTVSTLKARTGKAVAQAESMVTPNLIKKELSRVESALGDAVKTAPPRAARQARAELQGIQEKRKKLFEEPEKQAKQAETEARKQDAIDKARKIKEVATKAKLAEVEAKKQANLEILAAKTEYAEKVAALKTEGNKQKVIAAVKMAEERQSGRIAQAKAKADAATVKAREAVQAAKDITAGVGRIAREEAKKNAPAQQVQTAKAVKPEPNAKAPVADMGEGKPIQQPATTAGASPEPKSKLTYEQRLTQAHEQMQQAYANMQAILAEGPPKPKAEPKAPAPKVEPEVAKVEDIAEAETRKRAIKRGAITVEEKTLSNGQKRYKGTHKPLEGYVTDSGIATPTRPDPKAPIWRAMREGVDTPIQTKVTLDEAIEIAKAHKVASDIQAQVDVANPANNVALARDLLDDAGYIPAAVRTQVENYLRGMENSTTVEARALSEAAGSRVESTLFEKTDKPLYLNVSPRTGDLYAQVINENGQLTRRYFREGTGSGYVLREGKRVKNETGLVSQVSEAKVTKDQGKYHAGLDEDGKIQVYDSATNEIIEQGTEGLTKASELADRAAVVIRKALDSGDLTKVGQVSNALKVVAKVDERAALDLLRKAPDDFKKAIYKKLTGVGCDG